MALLPLESPIRFQLEPARLADLRSSMCGPAHRWDAFPRSVLAEVWDWACRSVTPTAVENARSIAGDRRPRVACAISSRGLVVGGAPLHMKNSRQAGSAVVSALYNLAASGHQKVWAVIVGSFGADGAPAVDEEPFDLDRIAALHDLDIGDAWVVRIVPRGPEVYDARPISRWTSEFPMSARLRPEWDFLHPVDLPLSWRLSDDLRQTVTWDGLRQQRLDGRILTDIADLLENQLIHNATGVRETVNHKGQTTRFGRPHAALLMEVQGDPERHEVSDVLFYSGVQLRNNVEGRVCCAEEGAFKNARSHGVRRFVGSFVYGPTQNRARPCNHCLGLGTEHRHRAFTYGANTSGNTLIGCVAPHGDPGPRVTLCWHTDLVPNGGYAETERKRPSLTG